MTEPIFFRSPAEFRRWLERNHDQRDELWLGYYKKVTGTPSLTWAEAVDQALCFGWIDGVRKSLDTERSIQRFTPRRPRSNWSAVNIANVERLKKAGLMHPAGFAAFEKRTEARSGIYSYEQRKDLRFEPAQLKAFKANKEAWSFFDAQPPSYRQLQIYWVVSAKKEETRGRRLQKLIDASAERRRL
ncbi:MAG: YdeI/OmpD-associated family protein [Actinomycetota bacterium]